MYDMEMLFIIWNILRFPVVLFFVIYLPDWPEGTSACKGGTMLRTAPEILTTCKLFL